MTDRQARHIADVAIRWHRAQAALAESERLGHGRLHATTALPPQKPRGN